MTNERQRSLLFNLQCRKTLRRNAVDVQSSGLVGLLVRLLGLFELISCVLVIICHSANFASASGLIIDRRQQLVGGRVLPSIYSINRTSKAVQERLQQGTELIRRCPCFQWITAAS